jgi:hypothetical protein
MPVVFLSSRLGDGKFPPTSIITMQGIRRSPVRGFFLAVINL